MSWADEANAKAHTQWYNPDHGDGDCMKCQVNFQVREGFEMGAKWQREQLHTDEAVERAAEAIWERNHGPAEKPVTWQTTLEEIRDLWREDARAVIAALNQERW